MKTTEQDLAEAVVAWLADGWDVYQEVQHGENRADIVAVETCSPKRVWVIEVKNSLSMTVLAQAWSWTSGNVAHRVSIAVPSGRNWKQRAFAEAVAAKFGIGVLYVDPPAVSERVDPVLRRKISWDIRKSLHEEQKTHAKAGSAAGGHWTAFKGTCRAAGVFIRQNPGCTLQELSRGIEHHYASNKSARGSLAGWIRAGKLVGIRLDESASPLRCVLGNPKEKK